MMISHSPTLIRPNKYQNYSRKNLINIKNPVRLDDMLNLKLNNTPDLSVNNVLNNSKIRSNL